MSTEPRSERDAVQRCDLNAILERAKIDGSIAIQKLIEALIAEVEALRKLLHEQYNQKCELCENVPFFAQSNPHKLPHLLCGACYMALRAKLELAKEAITAMEARAHLEAPELNREWFKRRTREVLIELEKP